VQVYAFSEITLGSVFKSIFITLLQLEVDIDDEVAIIYESKSDRRDEKLMTSKLYLGVRSKMRLKDTVFHVCISTHTHMHNF
jgi:hypothetical protein